MWRGTYFLSVQLKCDSQTDRCYWLLEQAEETWTGARNICQSGGGDLAVIETKYWRRFVTDNFKLVQFFSQHFQKFSVNRHNTCIGSEIFSGSCLLSSLLCCCFKLCWICLWALNLYIWNRNKFSKQTEGNAGNISSDRHLFALMTCVLCCIHEAEFLWVSCSDIKLVCFSLFGLSRYIWIGLNDLEVEGTYQWLNTNQSVGPIIWGPEEPNGGENENCVAIWSLQHQRMFNVDAPCSYPLNFLCSGQGKFVFYDCSSTCTVSKKPRLLSAGVTMVLQQGVLGTEHYMLAGPLCTFRTSTSLWSANYCLGFIEMLNGRTTWTAVSILTLLEIYSHTL